MPLRVPQVFTSAKWRTSPLPTSRPSFSREKVDHADVGYSSLPVSEQASWSTATAQGAHRSRWPIVFPWALLVSLAVLAALAYVHGDWRLQQQLPASPAQPDQSEQPLNLSSVETAQVDELRMENASADTPDLQLFPEIHDLRRVKTEVRYDNWRENLLPDVYYITGGLWDGAANQLHSATNLIHLGALTKRVAILPQMDGVHIEGGIPSRFSDWWDLERFQRITGVPVLEIDDIRTNQVADPGLPWDSLGCWSTHEATLGDQAWSGALTKHHLRFDLWPLPPDLQTNDEIHRGELHFTDLKWFDSSVARQQWWIQQLTDEPARYEAELSGLHRKLPTAGAVPPIAQIFCVDYLFQLKSAARFTSAFDPSPYGAERESWETTGQHLRWSQALDRATDSILTDILGSPKADFLALHIRRGDFGQRSVALYDQPLEDVRRQLLDPARGDHRRPDARDLPVVVVSDDNNPAFRQECAGRGWISVVCDKDHDALQTATRYGSPWYPSMCDANILSRSVGIVGSAGSTFSYQAILRVQGWQHGAFAWAARA